MGGRQEEIDSGRERRRRDSKGLEVEDGEI